MTLPLEGLRVLDLSRYIAGPLCCQYLADFGAEVIKIEPQRGEEARDTYPFFDGYSLYFAAFNRNKRSITLNLRTEAGKALLRELIVRSDVLVQNFRPGVMEEMGFDYAELARINPRTILVNISGFGQTGPLARWPTFDDVGQAMSGLMDMTGPADGPPTLIGTFIVDHLSALNATIGALAALQHRERTGRGQQVEATLIDSALGALMFYIPWQVTSDKRIARNGNRNRFYAASNTYQTRDGFIHIAATRDHMWGRLAEVIGRPDLAEAPGYAKAPERVRRIDEIDDMITAWTRRHTTAEAATRLAEAGVPCGPILSLADVAAHPYLRERRMLFDVDVPNGRRVPVTGNPVRIGEFPFEVRQSPPALGQDNEYIYGSLLGHSESELAAWSQAGVI